MTGGFRPTVVQAPWPPEVAGWYPGHLMHEEALALEAAADPPEDLEPEAEAA